MDKNIGFPSLITNQIPAVTNVDLCTKALTGVGAAIAAGNQLKNGHCALFVKVNSTIIIRVIIFILSELLNLIFISQ